MSRNSDDLNKPDPNGSKNQESQENQGQEAYENDLGRAKNSVGKFFEIVKKFSRNNFSKSLDKEPAQNSAPSKPEEPSDEKEPPKNNSSSSKFG